MTSTLTRRETTPIPETDQPIIPPRRSRRAPLAAVAVSALVLATGVLVGQVVSSPSDVVAPDAVSDNSYVRNEDARFDRLAPDGFDDGSSARAEDARFDRLAPDGFDDASARAEDERFARLAPGDNR